MVGGSSSAAAARQLAEKYGMDVERLEKLVRSVHVPSVREQSLGAGAGAGSVRYVRDAENGDDIEVKEVRFFFFDFMGEPTNIDVGHCYVLCTGGVEGANVYCAMMVNDIQTPTPA